MTAAGVCAYIGIGSNLGDARGNVPRKKSVVIVKGNFSPKQRTGFFQLGRTLQRRAKIKPLARGQPFDRVVDILDRAGPEMVVAAIRAAGAAQIGDDLLVLEALCSRKLPDL